MSSFRGYRPDRKEEILTKDIIRIIYNEIRCLRCGKVKYPMDMHNKEICKVCWLREYRSKFVGRTKKMLATRFGKK